MEGKVKAQRASIAQFLKYCEQVFKAPEVKTSKGYLEGKEKMIGAMWSTINAVNTEIVENVTPEFKVTVDPEFETNHKLMQGEYERAFENFDKVTILICTAMETLRKGDIPKVQPLQLPENLVLQTSNHSSIKLKPIDIKPFHGDFTKWISFKNMFESLVKDNEEFTNLQRMHYLDSCLEGEAGRLISQFNITEESFVPAYEAVKERYNNEVILVDSHIIRILSQPDLKSESSEGLKEMMDVTTENLRALKSLKIDIEACDPIWLLLLVQKLDSATRRLWEQNLKPKIRPTMKEFLDFLAGRYHALGCQQKFKFSMQPNNQPATEQGNRKDVPYENRNQRSDNYKPHSGNVQFPPRIHQSFHNSTDFQRRCPFRCINPHEPLKCERFLKADINTKHDLVSCARLCKNCLRSHKGNCYSNPACHKCNGFHHTSLHPETTTSIVSERSQVQSLEQVQANVPNVQSHHVHIDQVEGAVPADKGAGSLEVIAWDEKVLLATAIVLVKSNRDDRFYPFRALIDQASEASYASEFLVQTLGLCKRSVIANTSGLGGVTTGQIKHVVEFEVGSKRNPSFVMKVQGPVVKKVTNPLPSATIVKGDWQHIQQLQLADPQYDTPARIDLLLGSPVYGLLLLPGLVKASPSEPIAQNTEFGWILSGPVREAPIVRNISTFHLKIDLDNQLKKFFEMEEVSKERVRTQEEVACERFYMETYKRREDGRFIVALPFKADPRTIGSSKG